MISVINFRGSIDSWEVVRFPVENKENDQGSELRVIYPIYSFGRLKG